MFLYLHQISRGQKHDGQIDRSLTHAPLACFNIPLQKSVDHIIKFHEALVLAKVILRFAQNIVDFPI